MALQKQTQNINFSQGLDTKTDPFQVSAGKFLSLKNTIFTKGGRLQKRNGYGSLTSLPDTTSGFLTTFNGDLTAIGNSFQAYSSGQTWVDKGYIQPVELNTLTLIRNNTNQSQVDSVVAPNGYICTVYTDQNPSNLSAKEYKYVIADSDTGQNIIPPTLITTTDGASGGPRIFLLQNHFIIVYTRLISAAYHLSYIAISVSSPSIVTSPADIVSAYTPATTVAWDAVVFNSKLFVAWNEAGGTGMKMTFLQSNLIVGLTVNPDASHAGTLVSVTADSTNGIIWVSYYDSGTTNTRAFARDQSLNAVLAPTAVVTGVTLSNLTSVASQGVMHVFYEVATNYSYDSSIPSHSVSSNTLTQAGVVGSPASVILSVGLASKAFYYNGVIYFLTAYQSPYQNTYFLVDENAHIIAKVAYTNGGGYLPTGLPSVTLNGNVAQIPYLFKDLIQSVNKNTNVASGNQVAGIFSQLGINLASFTIGSDSLSTAEIGTNLNLSGGFLWAYDGYLPVEQNFFVYPDSVEVSTDSTSGSLSHQQYFYQVTYEWTDNQGNAFRSAPSIPASITLTSTNSVTLNIPYLRLTYKVSNPVKIVIYRWSAAQQSYYQVTSIGTPILNSTTSNSVTFVDTLADADILGNNLIYTTGGVVENSNGDAFDNVFIFDDRLWGISSENKNLLFYSKQVISSTPVEMSELLTYYIAPNVGAQGATGPLLCGAPMDDKAILFKASAINYFNGTGPDITGANSQYSQPIFITSTVGCSNSKSIVFQPQGLMFEFASEAGNQIWLLGRDLQTSYLGAAVEDLTSNATVLSAVNIPGTNQVRFTMSSGITLMYDYYYGQWGTFSNVPAISSTIYQGVQTYINSFGAAYQETPGIYLDGSNPVLMSFATSWFNLAGLQGYERAYYFYLLGTFITPHILNVEVAYDYSPAASDQTLILPGSNNFNPTYGQDLLYGSGNPYGGNSSLEQWRVFFSQQRCQAFQLQINEIYDPSYGVAAGAGFTLSGLALITGLKKGFTSIKASQSVGLS